MELSCVVDGLIGVIEPSIERWRRRFEVLRKTASPNQGEWPMRARQTAGAA